jgi:hypothetical protein
MQLHATVVTLVFLSVFLAATTTYTPIPPLVCTTKADAIAVVAAACQLVVDCRFELGSGANALPLTSWDVLLTVQSGLVSNSSTVPLANDARYSFTDEWYILLPLMAYDNTSVDAVDCSTIANNPQTNLTAPVFNLLDALSKYIRYMSVLAKCPDVNQIPLWSNASGTPKISCQCVPGKVCSIGSTTSDTILQVAGIFLMVLALVFAAYSMVTNALTLRHSKRNIHRYRRLQDPSGSGGGEDSSHTSLGLIVAQGPDFMG